MTEQRSSTGEVATTQTALPARPVRKGRVKRALARLILLVVVPAIAIMVGSYWYTQSGRYVTSDNAYVKTHVIAISPSIDGRVNEVAVRENQLVRKGDILFRLDPNPHAIQLQLTQARRAAVRFEVESFRADYRQTVSELAEAKEKVAYLGRQLARQRKLASKGVTTSARLEQAEFDVDAARKRVATLRQKRGKVLANLGGDPDLPVESHPLFLQAEADRAAAALNLAFTEVRAPATGTITRLRMEPGEWVEEGKPVFGVISDKDAWIEANLKETQLTHVRVGQAVRVELDAYPGREWNARIHSISAATGSEFAVLPPQNASGNWVKVVQRVPVRLEIQRTGAEPPLRAGMTASVSIDTKRDRRLGNVVRAAIGKLGNQ